MLFLCLILQNILDQKKIASLNILDSTGETDKLLKNVCLLFDNSIQVLIFKW